MRAMVTWVSLLGATALAGDTPAAPRTTMDFDRQPVGRRLTTQYATKGIVFEGPPVIAAAPPGVEGATRFLATEVRAEGDDERRLLAPMRIRFVDPDNPDEPATSSFVQFDIVAVDGERSLVIMASQPDGSLLFDGSWARRGGWPIVIPYTDVPPEAVNLHAMEIRFGPPSTLSMVAHGVPLPEGALDGMPIVAGIDNLVFARPEPVAKPSRGRP